jgi:general secretion pathway protein N
MMVREVTPRLGIRLAVLLVSALSVPASSSALPTEGPDNDVQAARHADGLSASSLWEQPTAPAPVVVGHQEPTPAPGERAQSANPLWAIPLATLSATRERPVFSPSRRPPPPAVASVTVAQAPPPPPKPARVERPQLSLVGTIAGGDESFGIFVDQTTKTALRLKIGEDYQGWRLRSVQGREVTLERDQQTTIFSLPQPSVAPTGQMRSQADKVMTQRQGSADSLPRGGRR